MGVPPSHSLDLDGYFLLKRRGFLTHLNPNSSERHSSFEKCLRLLYLGHGFVHHKRTFRLLCKIYFRRRPDPMRNQIGAVKFGLKVDFQRAQKKRAKVVPWAVLSWFSIFFALFHTRISHFRIVLLLLSQILNSTSDPRQDGQSSPFNASSS